MSGCWFYFCTDDLIKVTDPLTTLIIYNSSHVLNIKEHKAWSSGLKLSLWKTTIPHNNKGKNAN